MFILNDPLIVRFKFNEREQRPTQLPPYDSTPTNTHSSLLLLVVVAQSPLFTLPQATRKNKKEVKERGMDGCW